MDLFRKYDIRGIYGENLTDDTALRLGKAFGTFLKGNKTVCVGFDTRPSSEKLFNNFSSGLVSTGCNIISLGLVTSPITYFYAWKNKMFGCMITASHSPAEWNGFKLIEPNGTSLLEGIEKVKGIFDSRNFSKGEGRTDEDKKAVEKYENFLQKKFGTLKGRVVTDFLGGSGVKAMEVFKNMGLEIIPLHKKPDPSLYGFHLLEPWGKLLTDIKEMVKEEEADFGVAFDCDADRSIFIGPDGENVDTSVISGIFIENILKKKKGKIVCAYDCASELEKFSKKLGGDFSWSRVGHSFLEKECLKEKVLFAAEQSAHFYLKEFYPFSDGILSTLYLAKILNENRKKLNELTRKIKFHPIGKTYINARTDENKVRVVEELRKDFPKSKDIMDGFKIKLNEDEWVLIRSSQTLPEINIGAEGKNKKRLEEIMQKYSKLINQKMANIS
jgi:phosphomannomutase/phosphoglucomutase